MLVSVLCAAAECYVGVGRKVEHIITVIAAYFREAQRISPRKTTSCNNHVRLFFSL